MSSFNTAHRLYVKSLYKRMLKNEADWVIRYDLMRGRRLAIRAEFERNRCAPARCRSGLP
jgi:NADH dehydrogenase (ubiquinone) 1 beta subcomplex subunit 9